MSVKSVAACICLHDDSSFLRFAIEAIIQRAQVFCFISRTGWDGSAGDWASAARVARDAGAIVVVGDWPHESLHRATAISHLREMGFSHALTIDSDEILESALLEHLVTLSETTIADRVYVHMETYWKSVNYVIRPREQLTPIVLINLEAVKHLHIREYVGGTGITLGPEFGVLHHLSYCGGNHRITRKLTTWSHRDELVPRWYSRVWQAWDQNKLLRGLHPTHPNAFGFAERVRPPSILRHIEHELGPIRKEAPVDLLKSTTVVIPLYGGEGDIARCLDSLADSLDVVAKILVIDDCSPDNAAEVAASRDCVHLVSNSVNRGFSYSSNVGLRASETVFTLFLNSDTIVPRSSLLELLQTLNASAHAAAIGPVSNCAGHMQQIHPTYTSYEQLDLFAEDLSTYAPPASLVDMLVGFCLLCRTQFVRDIGGFDERFGIGMYEDNDLSYRLRREGHQLLLCHRAFVHHEGSKSLRRHQIGASDLLEMNSRLFREKWKPDLDTGYASNLSGFTQEPIVFNESRRPERIRKDLQARATIADVSLCMIVKDEARVLRSCLESCADAFKEIIVVDTGSSDDTIAIATSYGCQVHNFEWCEDFSAARNQSMSYATGGWIFWLDADDTVTLDTLARMQDAALTAPPDVLAFVIPVKFVDDMPNGGTSVDHVKLFRNIRGLQWEGRIHEQILGSLRQAEGQIVRLAHAFVLHSGYDTTEEGQGRKRVRDVRLLELDLQERPQHPFVHFNYGMSLYSWGNYEAAIEPLLRSIDLASSAESHVRKAYALLGASLFRLGLTDKALEMVNLGLSVVGPDPELLFQKANILTSMHRNLQAIRCYEDMPLDTSGFFSSVDGSLLTYKRLFNLGLLYSAMGEYELACSTWHRAVETYSHPDSAYELAHCLLGQGDHRAAMAMAEVLLRLEGPTERFADLILKVQGHRGEDLIEQMLAREGEWHFVRMVLARRLLRSNREVDAIQHLRHLSSCRFAEASYYLGLLEGQSGRYEGALRYMEDALALDPDNAKTATQIGILRSKLASHISVCLYDEKTQEESQKK